MKLNFTLDIGDGPIELSTTLMVIILWERKFKRKASDMGSGMGMEDLAYIAYECCRTQNVSVPPDFEQFLKRIVTLEFGEQTVNPT